MTTIEALLICDLPDIMLGHVNLGFGAVELVVLPDQCPAAFDHRRGRIDGHDRQQGSVIP